MPGARSPTLCKDESVDQLALVFRVGAVALLRGRGVSTGPPALVFNFKCHSLTEYLHIAAN